MAIIEVDEAATNTGRMTETQTGQELRKQDLQAGRIVSLILVSIIVLGFLMILATVLYCF